MWVLEVEPPFPFLGVYQMPGKYSSKQTELLCLPQKDVLTSYSMRLPGTSFPIDGTGEATCDQPSWRVEGSRAGLRP